MHYPNSQKCKGFARNKNQGAQWKKKGLKSNANKIKLMARRTTTSLKTDKKDTEVVEATDL